MMIYEDHRLDSPQYYINRELSWLSFNERVLEEAKDESNPLFERLKFLGITSSNQDEFFMVRVAWLQDQIKAGINYIDDKTGMTARELLNKIITITQGFTREQYRTLNKDLNPRLKEEGIHLLNENELNSKQEEYIYDFFHRLIFPVLTPMAVDASRPFPRLYNRTLNIAVLINSNITSKMKEYLFAVVQVPSVLPRFIELPGKKGMRYYILLEDVIHKYLQELFKGHKIISASPFRITRNADLILNEESADDLLEEIEKELKKRKIGAAVRVEVRSDMDPFLREFLEEWEEVQPVDIYEIDGPLDLTFLHRFASIEGYDHLRFQELSPQMPQDLIGEADIFEAISHKDVLLYHPYESFDPVVHFVRQAANDPRVLAIKQTLYRVGGDSPLVEALAQAAENGKQVTVLVELKARFEEEKNIVWAKKLEQAGCHVIYGLVGLKTHAKMILIVRQEGENLKRYVHLGTGNYNENTAKLYTDLGLLTANEKIGDDVSLIFNQLSGYSSLPQLEQVRVAPKGLRDSLISEIEEVIFGSPLEKPGRIIAKMNALTDKEIIKALYRASCAGVEIDLIVRGICCLRPGIPGISENIRVYSIVGRFLEHSRIYYFHSGKNENVYLSSADWMTRNLERRVETFFPILDAKLKSRIKQYLDFHLKDNMRMRLLMSDGTYKRIKPQSGEKVNSQLLLFELATKTAKLSSRIKNIN